MKDVADSFAETATTASRVPAMVPFVLKVSHEQYEVQLEAEYQARKDKIRNDALASLRPQVEAACTQSRDAKTIAIYLYMAHTDMDLVVEGKEQTVVERMHGAIKLAGNRSPVDALLAILEEVPSIRKKHKFDLFATRPLDQRYGLAPTNQKPVRPPVFVEPAPSKTFVSPKI